MPVISPMRCGECSTLLFCYAIARVMNTHQQAMVAQRKFIGITGQCRPHVTVRIVDSDPAPVREIRWHAEGRELSGFRV